jgi:hypothetical protein
VRCYTSTSHRCGATLHCQNDRLPGLGPGGPHPITFRPSMSILFQSIAKYYSQLIISHNPSPQHCTHIQIAESDQQPGRDATSQYPRQSPKARLYCEFPLILKKMNRDNINRRLPGGPPMRSLTYTIKQTGKLQFHMCPFSKSLPGVTALYNCTLRRCTSIEH